METDGVGLQRLIKLHLKTKLNLVPNLVFVLSSLTALESLQDWIMFSIYVLSAINTHHLNLRPFAIPLDIFRVNVIDLVTWPSNYVLINKTANSDTHCLLSIHRFLIADAIHPTLRLLTFPPKITPLSLKPFAFQSDHSPFPLTTHLSPRSLTFHSDHSSFTQITHLSLRPLTFPTDHSPFL